MLFVTGLHLSRNALVNDQGGEEKRRLISSDSPEEHQQQADGPQILPFSERWDLEGCNHANCQGHRDQIHDLWKQRR